MDRTDDRFLDEAVARGLLSRAQADDARRLAAALAEVEVALTLDEILARRGHLTRERSAELRRALARQRVGRYEVIERLGEGGSGVVWKARDVVLDRLVALKLLAPDARDDPEWRDRFLREARTAVTLNHAGLVRGLDCGEADGYLYFAMEYVPGETLAARLRREGRVPEKDAVRIALDVVRVLRYVSGLGIVHRDLKPDNVLVTPDGRVKVVDLGLAKPTREEAERSGAQSLLAGTPLYVAPEQIRDGDRVDWRADSYSLGATLYHLLAGRPPFPWEKGRDLLQRHLTEVPPSPREFALDVSPGAAAVVLKLLQKDAADRYARIEDLEADLESVLAGRPPLHTASFASERRPTIDVAAARAAAPPRKRALPIAAAVTVVAAVAAVAVGSVLFAMRCGVGPALPPNLVGPPTDPVVPPGQPPASPQDPRPPVAADTPAEAAARRALEAARRAAAELPDDAVARRDAFRFVVERHAGTASAEIAKGIVESLSREIETAGARRVAAVRESAAVAEAAGRLGEAWRAWDAVALDLAGTRAGDEAAAEARRLREAAEARLRIVLDRIRERITAREFEEARALLREADALGLGWAVSEVASRRRDVDAAESAWVADRASSRPQFERLWGAAVLRAGADGGLDAALAALDAASKAELALWDREIDALRIDLLAAARRDRVPSAVANPLDMRADFFVHLTQGELTSAEALVPSMIAAGARGDELRDAVARVRAALRADADGELVLAERARAESRLDDAAQFVERALARSPGHPRARVLRATLAAAKGRNDAAIAELREVLEGPSPPAEAHLRLGQVLSARADSWAQAQTEVEMFLSLAPEADPLRAEAKAALESVVSRRAAARVRELTAEMTAARDRGDLDAAIAAGETIVSIGSADLRTLLALGDLYAETDRAHDAFLAYRRILEAPAYEREAPRAQAAIRRLEVRYVPAPADRDAAAAARTLFEAGRIAESRDAWTALLRRAPFLEDALAGAAEAWLARAGSGPYGVRDDPMRALRLTAVLRARNASHVRGMELRAEALRRTGQLSAALDLAKECIPLDPLRPDPCTTAGFASLQLDDAPGALGHLAASLQRRATPEAYFGRALAWEKLGRRSSAVDEAMRLAEEFEIPEPMRDDVKALFDRLGLELAPPK